MKNEEIEIKLRVDGVNAITKRLIELNALPRRFGLQETYGFFTADESNIKAGIFPRIRTEGGKVVLTVKVKTKVDDKYFRRDEYDLVIGNVAAGKEILAALGYTEVKQFNKYRKTYDLHGVSVCVDQLDFGTFVEIEASPEKIEETIKLLELEQAERFNMSYLGLQELLK